MHQYDIMACAWGRLPHRRQRSEGFCFKSMLFVTTSIPGSSPKGRSDAERFAKRSTKSEHWMNKQGLSIVDEVVSDRIVFSIAHAVRVQDVTQRTKLILHPPLIKEFKVSTRRSTFGLLTQCHIRSY